MKIYAIFEDNGEQWEDHYYGIMEGEIYSDKEKADKMCAMLNNPQFIPPTREEYEEVLKLEQWPSYEDYKEEWQYEFDNPYYKSTYEVIELTIKT